MASGGHSMTPNPHVVGRIKKGGINPRAITNNPLQKSDIAVGKLRPLGISTVRDRICMTAAMLVLEPIFEADLPPEQYAYRPGRNAQQAVVKVDGLLFRGQASRV
jgi:retron-type reverse transcriptase